MSNEPTIDAGSEALEEAKYDSNDDSLYEDENNLNIPAGVARIQHSGLGGCTCGEEQD